MSASPCVDRSDGKGKEEAKRTVFLPAAYRKVVCVGRLGVSRGQIGRAHV